MVATTRQRKKSAAAGAKEAIETTPPVETSKLKLPKHESKLQKILTRLVFGLMMIFSFFLFVYLGHGWITIIVGLIQLQIFQELLKVRYNDYRGKMVTDSVPLFRTIQWSWFLLTMFFTYGEAAITFALLGDRRDRYQLVELLVESWTGIEFSSTDVLYAKALRIHKFVTFVLYSAVFVVTVLSFRKDVIKYQFSQLTWTLMTTALISFQMNLAIYNIFEGIFWFLLPPSLVVCNDCFAYFCGMALSGKIFKNKDGGRLEFLPFLSPNKTWEGFVGAFIFTCIFGFFIFPVVYNIDWFVCPISDLPLGQLTQERVYTCTKPDVFVPQEFKPLDFRLLRYFLGQWWGTTYTVELLPVQYHSFYLAIFASSVAPFGGFFASAIKRAYGIKDFDSIIPGHGGLTDRMDCQLIMTACTFVYYNTFVKPHFQRQLVRDILKELAGLKPETQMLVYEQLGALLGK